MKKVLLVGASMLASFGGLLAADAGPAAWCKGTTTSFGRGDFDDLSGTDPERVVKALVEASCSNDDEANANRAAIDKARAAWSKKLAMDDGDWADVLAFTQIHGSYSEKTDYSTKDIGKWGPIDQYWAIHDGFHSDAGYDATDPLYTADAIDATLTELGRVSLVEKCLKEVDRSDDTAVTTWATCAPDIEKLDVAKAYAELHGDKDHDGSFKTWIRFRVLRVGDTIKQYNDRKAALIKKDDEYKKVWDVAAKARAEWAKGVGANTKLLELAQQMDSATWFHSRKLFDGCEAKTAEALAAAASTIPAKSFATMHDVRDDPFKGFGYAAAGTFANTPAVEVAAAAYAACQPKSMMGSYLSAVVGNVPGFRGPRGAAMFAIANTTFKFDDTNHRGLHFPEPSRPYPRTGSQNLSSAGGVVKSVKLEKDFATVSLEKTMIMQEDCVKEHRGRAARIRSDGSIEYEIQCDQTKMVQHDNTWGDFKIDLADAKKWLKPGVLFSAIGANGPLQIVAIWPNKTAKLPSMVLGGTVK